MEPARRISEGRRLQRRAPFDFTPLANGGAWSLLLRGVVCRYQPQLALALGLSPPFIGEYPCWWMGEAGDSDELLEYVTRWVDPANAGVAVPGGLPASLIGVPCPWNDGDLWWDGTVADAFDPTSGGNFTSTAVGALGDPLPPGATGLTKADGSPFPSASFVYGVSASGTVYVSPGAIVIAGVDPGFTVVRDGSHLDFSGASLAFYLPIAAGSLVAGDQVVFIASASTKVSPKVGANPFEDGSVLVWP